MIACDFRSTGRLVGPVGRSVPELLDRLGVRRKGKFLRAAVVLFGKTFLVRRQLMSPGVGHRAAAAALRLANNYDALRQALEAEVPSSTGTSSADPITRPRPTTAEFALSGPILPLLTETVLVAEQVRAAAMSRHGTPSVTLAGKSADGERVQGQHAHAHYVPDARGRTDRVTHVLVYAPAGFSESEQAALARVSFLARRLNRPTLAVALSGFGAADDFRDVTPLFGVSTRWRSRTPFVLVRHPRRGKDTPRDQVARELRLRGLPEPSEIISIPGALLHDSRAGDARLMHWLAFVMTRDGREHPHGGFGFEVVFPEPVRGPILLGYGCHYGLGQFEALP